MKTENLSHQFTGEASPRKIEKVCQSLIEGVRLKKNYGFTQDVVEGYDQHIYEGVIFGIKKSGNETTIIVEYVCN